MNRKGTKDPSKGKVYPTGTRTLLYDSISSLISLLTGESSKSFLTPSFISVRVMNSVPLENPRMIALDDADMISL
ncbi:hypothetical protein SDC9_175918 [bioreactor metagenome]|uniref:Uncharacterized protein n=1 Tax=bioreactor metagenome TaxID=1076179 RepID=A0A645GQL3_9ZZZZ